MIIYIYPKEQLQKMVTINPHKTLLRSAIRIKVFRSAKDEQVLTYYIYIYGRGRRFPERTSIRIIELEKKQCFTVVKWRFFMSFFSLLMSFNYGSIFFRPSKLKSIMDHHNMFFFGVLIFSIGITRCTFCAISKIIGKGYNILCFHRYFDVMLFFIGNSQ